ncbi:MAG: kelch repeat-containing protein [bacterium]
MKKKLIISILVVTLGWGFANAGTWEEFRTDFAPNARIGHVAIYDPNSDAMVVMGEAGATDQNIYSLDLGTGEWIIKSSSEATVARADHSIVYDSSRNRALVFGGSTLGRQDVNGYENVTYYWNFATPAWGAITTTGTAPMDRIDHSAIYDSANDCMIVFGGIGDDGLYKNDVYSLDLATAVWSQITTSGTAPQSRFKHSAIYDSTNNRMLMLGGSSALSLAHSDLWALDLRTDPGTFAWSQLSTTGDTFPGRTGQSIVFDPDTGTQGSIIVFGGMDPLAIEYKNDTYILDIATLTWSKVEPGLVPPSRRTDHVAVYDTDNNRMFIFGGYSGTSNLNSCYTLDITDRWPSDSDDSEVFNYPNPFKAGAENTNITFYMQSAGKVNIKIYTLVGGLVKTWSLNSSRGINKVVWDGKNGEEKVVGNGGYICVVEKPNSNIKFKIAVAK